MSEDVGAVVVFFTDVTTEMLDEFAFSNVENVDPEDDDNNTEPPV